MIAHVTDHSLVLEDNDGRSKGSMQCARETTNITHPVQEAVDFSPYDLQVSLELISDRKLHIVVVIIHPERTRHDTEHPNDMVIDTQRSILVIQVELRHLNVAVDVLTDLRTEHVPLQA